MSKVMIKPLVKAPSHRGSTTSQHDYFKMRSSEASTSILNKKNSISHNNNLHRTNHNHNHNHHMFNRSMSLSETEIHTHFGFSDSEEEEEEKSEPIEDFILGHDNDEPDNDVGGLGLSMGLINSDFDDEDDEERDPYQRQMGYPPLPKYKTPIPANPLDKLGTLTPLGEMTEPMSSGANSPASFILGNKKESKNNNSNNNNSKLNAGNNNNNNGNKSRGPSRLAVMDKESGPSLSRSPSRNSMSNLTVDTAPMNTHNHLGRSSSRNSMTLSMSKSREPSPPSPTRTRPNITIGEATTEFVSDFPSSSPTRGHPPRKNSSSTDNFPLNSMNNRPAPTTATSHSTDNGPATGGGGGAGAGNNNRGLPRQSSSSDFPPENPATNNSSNRAAMGVTTATSRSTDNFPVNRGHSIGSSIPSPATNNNNNRTLPRQSSSTDFPNDGPPTGNNNNIRRGSSSDNFLNSSGAGGGRNIPRQTSSTDFALDTSKTNNSSSNNLRRHSSSTDFPLDNGNPNRTFPRQSSSTDFPLDQNSTNGNPNNTNNRRQIASSSSEFPAPNRNSNNPGTITASSSANPIHNSHNNRPFSNSTPPNSDCPISMAMGSLSRGRMDTNHAAYHDDDDDDDNDMFSRIPPASRQLNLNSDSSPESIRKMHVTMNLNSDGSQDSMRVPVPASKMQSRMAAFSPADSMSSMSDAGGMANLAQRKNNNSNSNNRNNNSSGSVLGPKSPNRTATPLPRLEDEVDSDATNIGMIVASRQRQHQEQQQLGSLGGKDYDYDLSDVEKMQSLDRVRSWQRNSTGNGGSPVYSAIADAEFAAALDGMITKLHGSKVDWEHRVKLADDLTASLKNVSPQVLLKNLSQIIPLVSNIAAESHFRVSLSILNTITMLGDRLRDCKMFLGPKSIQNADLTWLIRRLCTVCGESRSTLRTEGALALSHLVKGAGPELVCAPLYSILSSESKKTSGTGRLTAGPRIKAAAIDALTFALLTFPRDDFDLPVLGKHACKSLWNTKRRVRQAALECLAVVAHAIGPATAMPMFRTFIEQTKNELTSSSSSSGTTKRGATNYTVATPQAAVSARVSRHLLPSPSPAGLVEYAVMIPQRTLQHVSQGISQGKTAGGPGTLDPVLSGSGSGKMGNRHSAMIGADISWIISGTGPIQTSTLYSPSHNLDWLAEESGTGWPSDGESIIQKSDRRHSKSKMKNSHSYNGTMDLLDTPIKPWSTSLSNPASGTYMERYHKSSSNGFLADNHHGGKGDKGDKGFTILPNKYPSHSSSNSELPNLSPYSHHNNIHNAFGDTFNSNLWTQHEEFMGFNNNNNNSSNNNNHTHHNHNHTKGPYSSSNNSKSSAAAHGHGPKQQQHGGGLNGLSSRSGSFLPTKQQHHHHHHLLNNHHLPSKYADSSSRFDAFSQHNASLDASDSDPENYGPLRSSNNPNSFQHQQLQHGSDDGHFIKIHREYDETDDAKNGLDSAGSANTRDSGVSIGTIPSPPSMQPYDAIIARSSIPKMTSKKKSPTPVHSQRPPENHLADSRSWRSTPDVPGEKDIRKTNDGSDISRSQSGSSGFLHRKPVLARASQRKTSSDSLTIQNRLSALELRDFDEGMESDTVFPKEKIPNPISYHLSLSTNNIANIHSEDEVDKSHAPYSTSSLRRPTNTNKKQSPKSVSNSRSRSRTPVGSRGMSSGLSTSMKGDAENALGLTSETSPPKNNLSVKKTTPKRVYKGSYRELSRNAPQMTQEVFPADLKPVDSPRHSLSLALNNLNSSEWETNLDGFRLLVRLSRHHPESLRTDLHNININGMRHVMNLRSQVCRSACLFFRELFLSQGKLMEQDAEKIAEKLLEKSADTNKFIREDSGSAIEMMVTTLSPAKVITCLDTYGLKHRNPIVRTTASKMLVLLVRRLGSERVLFDHPDKILPMIMHFLQEGSLETRTHGKAALAELITNKNFDAQLRRTISPDILRNVSKSISAIRQEVM